MGVMRITSAEFGDGFESLNSHAQSGPVVVTEEGRDALVVLSAAEWERMKRRDRQVGLSSELTDGWIEAVQRAQVPAGFADLDAEIP